MNMKFQIIYFAVEVMLITRKCYGGYLQIMTYSGCVKIISLIFDLDATAKSDNTM